MDDQELMGLRHSVDGLQDFVLKCLRCKGKATDLSHSLEANKTDNRGMYL